MKTALHLIPIFALVLLSACGDHKEVAAASSPAPQEKSNHIRFQPDSPQLQQLRVDMVKTADVPANEVVAPGKIEVNPNRVSHVVLPVTGRVVSVLVKIGDAVRQGEPVLKIESPDADTAVSTYLQSQAQVGAAKTALLKASTDLDRAKDLFEHKAKAQKEVLDAQATYDQAKSTLDQAQAASEQALRRLQILGLKPGDFGQQITVSAPISGKILELTVVPGEFRNDLTASLMTIADLSSVWVASDVPESDIRFIRLGERLDIELTAYPGETFHGRVTRIADAVDPQTRTVKVRAELDNPRERFLPEMFGTIRHTEGAKKAPVAPASAVVQLEGANVVYRELMPGEFEPVNVTLGPRVGNNIAIVSGLNPGDRIVVDGVMLLKSS